MSLRRLAPVLALTALVAAAAGCGDDGSEATPTTDARGCVVPGTDPVTFGEGDIPASVPADFPVPEEALVGSTLVDRANHRTEFALTVRLDVAGVVQYYTVSLVSAGFVVGNSAGDALGVWQIEFSRDQVLGALTVQSGGPGLATVVASFNTC